MEGIEHVNGSLDRHFDQYLVEMKPYVMRLPHKSDRQRCAMWIKKFCEPPSSGITGRKNRNMHAEVLLHMLKKGSLEGIFTQKPEHGPLPTLPAYMSIYYEDLHQATKENRIPDWVTGELGSDATGFSSLAADPAPAVKSFDEVRERFNEAVSRSPRGLRSEPLFGYQRDRTPSPPRVTSLRDERVPPLHLDDFALRTNKPRNLFPEDDDSTTTNGDLDIDFTRPKSKLTTKQRLDSIDDDWRNPSFGSSTFLRDSTLRSNSAFNDRETEMKAKMLEARFQEEKLILQQKHDSNVQKILDRKNREIEDLKLHYRTKSKEHDGIVHKLEKKVSQLQKELAHVTETKEHEIEQLKMISEETGNKRQQDLEKKLQESLAEYEQEKFELQKQHTRNIQELLDDTNNRLQRMEEEYSQQMEQTSSVTRDLELRIQQISNDAESVSKAKSQLDIEKANLQEKCDRLQGELIDYQARYTAVEKELGKLREEFDQEIRSLKNKHEANVEFIKQEHNNQASRASDTISELEQHIVQLKQALEKLEQDKNKHVRELEEQHYQDKTHLEHLHDKKVKSLQQEIEQLEEDSQKKLRKFEETLAQKEEEIRKVRQVQQERGVQSEKALENFKSEVQRNSAKMYEDMKRQMDKVEADLNRSKQLREKQAKEFDKQLEEERRRHKEEVAELKHTHEREKSRMLTSYHADKESWEIERENEMENMRQSMQQEIGQVEVRANERHERDSQMIKQLDEQTHTLREELVQANQLRKQQLVELGLLREEEKQKMMRDHEQQIAKLNSENEQQRLIQEKKHGAEMESVLEKTNARLVDIEKEYAARSQRTTDNMAELQKTMDQMKEDMNKLQQEADNRVSQTKQKYEEDRKKLKQQHANSLANLQQDIENEKNKVRQCERKLCAQEQEYEEKKTYQRWMKFQTTTMRKWEQEIQRKVAVLEGRKERNLFQNAGRKRSRYRIKERSQFQKGITGVRSQYEDKMRGYVSLSVRQELEDTIASLKSQVNSLQQRCAILQDEIEYRAPKYVPALTGSFTNTLDSTPTGKSPMSSTRENL